MFITFISITTDSINERSEELKIWHFLLNGRARNLCDEARPHGRALGTLNY